VIAEEDAAELQHPKNDRILEHVCRHVRAVGSGTVAGASDQIDGDAICRWIGHGGASDYRKRFWTLDPIDGTKGFLRGGQYAVALALVLEGRVVVAALACPNLPAATGNFDNAQAHSRGSIFHAARGQGAYVVADNGPGGDRARPVAIEVSRRDRPAEVRLCESVESGHSAHGDATAVAARLGITTTPLRMDSQAKYAAVARGECDAYLRLPTRTDYREKIWDHAAGALIVAESGGVVTDIAGLPLEFHHGRELAANRGVVVSNGRLHSRLIEAIQSLGIGAK
jgi:3'(2'), 5'-bisphosphate nucleotidase